MINVLLKLAAAIDALNERVGRATWWLILTTVLICAGNALARKVFSLSSNAFLEVQWYLFSAVFLLGAGYALKHQEHVRIDVIYSRLSPRGRAVVDILGSLCFVLPLCVLIVRHSWPSFTDAWETGETSADAGGLIRWPVLLLIPAGFSLLALQAIAEAIKCFVQLTNTRSPVSTEHGRE